MLFLRSLVFNIAFYIVLFGLVVLGAPLTIDADAFKTADGDLEASLRMICEAVHAQVVGSV